MKNKTVPAIRHSNRIRASLGEELFHTLNVALMVLTMLVTLYPILYVLFASLSEPARLARMRGILLYPLGLSFRGYEALFALAGFWSSYGNTLFYLVAGTLISMALTVIGAYVLSVRGYLLRTPFMMLLVFTMYFGGGMIPTYLVVKQMRIVDTIWAMLLPGCVSVYNMIVLRTAFEGIPDSLMESAAIDGANHLTSLVKIVLPLSKATLATITLFYAVGRWGEWYNAMVYLMNSRHLYPLQMFLRQMLVEDQEVGAITSAFSSETADYHLLKQVIKYATVIASTLPILLVYPFLQKYFTKGVLIGSIKG